MQAAIAAVLLALAVVGCEQNPDPQTRSEARESVQEMREDARDAASDTAERVREGAAELREEAREARDDNRP
ncbi:MAG: hypothetical protein DIU74_003615 [Pseudomonadota bacterium]|nr:MAG: hypothetical protein DIU74_02120 [Pseudomonadota bacterium]